MSTPSTIVKLSTYVLGDVVETCRNRLNSYLKASSDISPTSWLEAFNKMQSLIFRLSGLKDIDLYLTDIPIVITTPLQVTSIKLSDNALYKHISRIKLVKSSIIGFCTEKPVGQFEVITDVRYYNPRLRKQGVWCRDGEYVRIGIGDFTSLGTVTIKVYRTPIDMTAMSDLIDLPNENVPELEDFVLIKKLQDISAPIPQDLVRSEARLVEMEKKAVEQNKK